MFEPAIATIDVGTTSTRAIIFDKHGQEIAKHQIEYSTSASDGNKKDMFRKKSALLEEAPIFSYEGVAINITDQLQVENNAYKSGPTLRFPRPGWVECEPVHILANAVQCLADCLMTLKEVNLTLETKYELRAMGVANMRETTMVWNAKTGRPMTNGIVWNDTRTSDIVNEMNKRLTDKEKHAIREKTGLPISTYFSASKLRWLLDNDEDIRSLYESSSNDLMFGTIDTWLIYNLTKEHAYITDVTNACRTLFMDLTTCQYDDDLLSLWDIDPTKIQLPNIVSSSEKYGTFQIPSLSKLGFSLDLTEPERCALKTLEGVPLSGCLGDQSSSLVGQLAFDTGMAKCTFGTGAFVLHNIGETKQLNNNGLLTSVGFWFRHLAVKNKPHFVFEGSVAVAGSVVQWLRDNLKLIEKPSDIGPLASQVSDSGGVVFVPSFSGLFAPYWDNTSRGSIFGMTQYTTASHIARAAIEGVCYQTRAILKAMTDSENLSLSVDGGMSKSNEVMQIQSDILGPCIGVKRSPIAECTALGCAIAAGLGFEDEKDRVWKDLEDARHNISNANPDVFVCKLSDENIRKNWRKWEKAVERSKSWVDDDD